MLFLFFCTYFTGTLILILIPFFRVCFVDIEVHLCAVLEISLNFALSLFSLLLPPNAVAAAF